MCGYVNLTSKSARLIGQQGQKRQLRFATQQRIIVWPSATDEWSVACLTGAREVSSTREGGGEDTEAKEHWCHAD